MAMLNNGLRHLKERFCLKPSISKAYSNCKIRMSPALAHFGKLTKVEKLACKGPKRGHTTTIVFLKKKKNSNLDPFDLGGDPGELARSVVAVERWQSFLMRTARDI
jgi:hypothetical protein